MLECNSPQFTPWHCIDPRVNPERLLGWPNDSSKNITQNLECTVLIYEFWKAVLNLVSKCIGTIFNFLEVHQ